MPALSDAVWSEAGTTPDAIEAALRDLLVERARSGELGGDGGFVPARVLNMVVFVHSEDAAEIEQRLQGVGRYHASRTVVLSYDPDREDLNARVSVAAEGEPGAGELALLREIAFVEIGERHLDDLTTIADPLVISDLPTLLWSPGDHVEEADDALLSLAQATLIDSIEQPDWSAAIARACALAKRAYVVDLAWLRSTPWRERVAATFDPPRMRAELRSLSALTISHHPRSTVAAMLFAGWLASRLGWRLDRVRAANGGQARDRESPSVANGGQARDREGPGGADGGQARDREGPASANGDDRDATNRGDRDGVLVGTAETSAGELELRLQAAPELAVPGLAGIELQSASGLRLSLDRGPGGLHEHRREPSGAERTWTLLGASRGEGGILGEGIRQALLRDPTYLPALHAAEALLPETETTRA